MAALQSGANESYDQEKDNIEDCGISRNLIEWQCTRTHDRSATNGVVDLYLNWLTKTISSKRCHVTVSDTELRQMSGDFIGALLFTIGLKQSYILKIFAIAYKLKLLLQPAFHTSLHCQLQ